MNRLLVLLMVLLVNMVANAQTEKRIYTQAEQESAQERELQKRLEAIQDSVNYVNAVNALENWISYWKQTVWSLNGVKRLM